MNTISIFSQSKKYFIFEEKVKETTGLVLDILKEKKTHVEFFLIRDAEIKKINKKYRNKNVTTNVLSFCEPQNFVRGNQKGNFLGEIYIAPDYIQKRKQSLEHMIVHGILHLCGYDHMTKKDAERMEKKEIDILDRV